MDQQRLTLSSEALNDCRESMNAALTGTRTKLKEKKLREGTITAKIKIFMVDVTEKETGQVFTRLELEPDVGVKIGSKGKIDCQKVSGLYVEMDKEGIPVVASNQISMDELMEQGA